MRTFGLPVVSLSLFLPSLAAAAVTITYERKDDAGKTSTDMLVLQDQRLRMEGVGGGDGPRGGSRAGVMILDGVAKKLIAVDNERKTYNEITEAEMAQMRARMDEGRRRMAEQMKNVPPEQRRKMEQMMGGAMGGAMGGGAAPEVKYEALGGKKTVAGHACDMYRVSLANRVISESCLASWSSNVIAKAEAAEFKKLATEVQKMFDFMPAARQQDWTKAPGIPIEETHFGPDGKTRTFTRTLKSVTRGAVPASTFQPPAGFTKQAMMQDHPGRPRR